MGRIALALENRQRTARWNNVCKPGRSGRLLGSLAEPTERRLRSNESKIRADSSCLILTKGKKRMPESKTLLSLGYRPLPAASLRTKPSGTKPTEVKSEDK